MLPFGGKVPRKENRVLTLIGSLAEFFLNRTQSRKPCRNRLISILVLSTTYFLVVALPVSGANASRSVLVFDGLLYEGKPRSESLGLLPIKGSGDLWRPNVSHDQVDKIQVRKLLEPLRDSDGTFYLDIENWPLMGVPASVRAENIAKLTLLVETARSAAPNLRIGFYGILPGITYWPLQRHDDAYRDWLRVNRSLQGLAGHVDVAFPSLYTFYDDLEGWKQYARTTIAEARRFGKPVYVFLWPEFHDSNPLLGGQHIPAAFWREELEFCADLADGIVLWGGWKQRWDEKSAWWHETEEFLRRRNVDMAVGSGAGL
jgi:hypothetical protein